MVVLSNGKRGKERKRKAGNRSREANRKIGGVVLAMDYYHH